jgi:hypothetical protein
MIKRLTKHGNSLALVIDRPVLDLPEIDADTPFPLPRTGNALSLLPSWMKNAKKRSYCPKSSLCRRE